MSFQALCCIRFVGLVFLVSASSKAWAPSVQLPLLQKLGIEHRNAQKGFMIALIGVEAFLALSLLNLIALKAVLIASSLLLLGMVTVLARLHFKGIQESCSCYGQWLKLKPIEALKLDVIYLAMLGFGLLEFNEVEPSPLKVGPIIPLAFALGVMGLGKLRAKF